MKKVKFDARYGHMQALVLGNHTRYKVQGHPNPYHRIEACSLHTLS